MRILTYNIRGGLGMDGRRDSERVADAARACNPDVVCFQEVHQRLPGSRFINQPTRLQKRLQMPTVFQKTISLGVGGYGLAVATRLPLGRVCRRRLPSVREPRGVLQVEVEFEERLWTVFCTHWGLNTQERIGQARQLAQWVRETQGPKVVCGDLNDFADSECVRLLQSETGLHDSGAADDLPTYPSDAPRARIDFIFHSPDVTLNRLTVGDTSASDHCPVMADLSFGEREG